MLQSSLGNIPTIHPNDILPRGEKLDFDILRIPLHLPIPALANSLGRVRERFPWSGKDGEDHYQAVGLQYQDPTNPYLDAVDRQATYSLGSNQQFELSIEHSQFRFFDRRNLAGDEFEFVFRRLIPLRVFRTRLLTVASGFQAGNIHSDGPRSMRLHIPIETNSNAWIEVNGSRYHLPADGSGYLINTSLLHRIGNDGTTPRTHWVSVLYRNSEAHIHPVALLAIRDFWEKHHGPDGTPAEILKESCDARTGKRCELCLSREYRLFYVLGRQTLRSFCASCVESLIRSNKLEGPGASANGKYEEHASLEKKAVEKLVVLLEDAVEKCSQQTSS